MFRGLRAKSKLKERGYTIQKKTNACYEVQRIKDGKRVGLVWRNDDGWSEQHSKDMIFPTPEKAALWRWGQEFL